MAEEQEFVDAADMEKKRSSKLTERALEDKRRRLMGVRKSVLARITGKKKEIEALMSDDDNLQKVQMLMNNDYCSLVTEFEDITFQLWDLLSENEQIADKTCWVEPKKQTINQFAEKVEKWMDALSKSRREKDHVTANDDVSPENSASQVTIGNVDLSGKKSSVLGRTSVTSSRASSARAAEEAKLAGLVERAAVLSQKQELEMEGARIKAKLEKLTLEAAIAEKRATVRVLKEYERSEDDMNSYVRSRVTSAVQVKKSERRPSSVTNMPVAEAKMPSRWQQSTPTESQVVKSRRTDNTDRQDSDRSSDGILQVMQKQNMITEMLVNQQKQAQLPIKDVAVFRGDPLTYRSFIRAFEQAIEQRTDNDQDKLYYLQQYTAGEPQELVLFHRSKTTASEALWR